LLDQKSGERLLLDKHASAAPFLFFGLKWQIWKYLLIEITNHQEDMRY